MSHILALEKINKIFPNGFHAVKDASFEVEQGKTLVFLGTSGCGKTTILKMINRLIEPTTGTIYIHGKDSRQWDVIELRRSIGYVIQSIGLFPHMTIYDNVALVPRLKRWKEIEIKGRVYELMNMVHLNPQDYGGRFPRELSGGQQQRVGVIRALAADPDIILMDEPFGAIDPITRTQVQDEFLQLKSDLGKTIIIVTHDLEEATKLGDRIALIDKGQIIQLDTPDNLIERPETQFVRDFFKRHLSRRPASSLIAAEIAVAPQSKHTNDQVVIDSGLPAYEAISQYLDSNGYDIPVADEKGNCLGVINNQAIMQVFKREFWHKKAASQEQQKKEKSIEEDSAD